MSDYVEFIHEPLSTSSEVQTESESAERATTLIRPTRTWQPINLQELWSFRELAFFLAWRDIKVRYRQTLLGAAWALLQPAMMMFAFTFFFDRVAKISSGDLPYPIFVYAGLLPWTYFAGAVTNAGQSVIGSERLITKVYFPRLVIPFAVVGAAVVDFIIAFGLLLGLMIWYGLMPGPGILLVPVVFGLMVITAGGVGTLLAALNVAYRDFRYIIPFMVQLWMFATPTIYMQPADASCRGFQLLAFINPMTGLVAAFRAATLGGPIPWGQLGISSISGVLLLLGGCLYFRKVEDNFADII